MSVKELLARLRKRSDKFKEMKEDDRFQTMLEERKKSTDERELENRLEKIRQEKIKQQLVRFRKQDTMENRRMTMLNNNKKLFHSKPTVLNNNKKLFAMKKIPQGKIRFLDGGVKGL